MKIRFQALVFLSIAFTALGAVSTAAAQPAVYTLVRVTAPSVSPRPLIGTALDRTDREVLIFNPQTGKIAIPLDAITKLEWSAGRHHQAGRFAKRGAIAGGVLGALALLADDDYGCGTSGRTSCAAYGAALGALDGAMLGALVGLAFHTYDWKPDGTPRPDFTLGSAVSTNGEFRIAANLRW